MADRITTVEANLFDYGTTYRSDFRKVEMKDLIFTKYKAKPRCVRIRPPPLKDIHTLSYWKSVGIPFDLLHKPNDIGGKNPTKLQKPYEKPQDEYREEVQKTRPRVVITPAVCMDDIRDPRARDILIKSTYTSEYTRTQQNSVQPYFSVKAPLPGLPTCSNPLALPKLQAPSVSPEWRMNSVSWDSKQLRAHCESIEEFWQRRIPSKCDACDQTVAVQEHKKMLHQLK